MDILYVYINRLGFGATWVGKGRVLEKEFEGTEIF